jgi:2-dehydro-3-deoxyphosphogluconate aldolase / (4S)-4-hydroxy-2-oxoglutarate aldolase
VNLAHYLSRLRIIPVVEIDNVAHAVPLARALASGGLECAEITFRTGAAADSIAAITTEMPDFIVAAGTVRTVDQADMARRAGARFLVAPGLNSDVVAHSRALGLPMLPGVCTPTELEQAIGLGIQLLKFFPAEPAGGVGYLKALAGPYRDVEFVPTGGIGPANLRTYLALPSVVACAGSWMVRPSLIEDGDFGAITRLAAEAVQLAQSPEPGPGGQS